MAKQTHARARPDQFIGRRLTIEERVAVTHAKIAGLEKEIFDTRLSIPGESKLRALIRAEFADERRELGELLNDAVRVLRKIVETGRATQDEVNSWVERG